MRTWGIAALACALSLAGCAWPRPKADPTQFFILEGRSAPAEAGATRPRVELEDVEVPDYLMNPRMAARSQENRIDFAEFRRWAEPLPQGVARVIKADLAATAAVQPAPFPDGRPDYRLKARIEAFEGLRLSTGTAAIRVSISWELGPAAKGARAEPRRFDAAPAAWDGKDYGRLAKLLSDALAGFCAEVARALTGTR